jgi:hypothetical protein
LPDTPPKLSPTKPWQPKLKVIIPVLRNLVNCHDGTCMLSAKP